MLNARIVTVVAAIICILPLVAPTLSAQDTASLPPGIQNIDVDGQALDSATVPVTSNASPEISGRLESPVPVIELAVGDAEPIRFSAEVDDRGRFRAVVPQALANGQYPLAINDIPVGTFTIDSTAPAAADDGRQREGRDLLDIARVVPYPVDFGELLPGLGFLDGRFYTIDEEAARTAAANGDPTAVALRDTRRALAEGGWLQRYENRLAVPNPENADLFDIQVSSFVVEYATPEAAGAAFTALTGDDQPVESPLVGDESVLSLLTGVTPDTGVEYQAARLMFRVGPMLGMIVYADLLGQQLDLALLDSVAQAVAGRGAVVAEQGSVPLGTMALRLDPSPATGRLIRRDLYDVRAGALTPLFAEDESVREGRVTLLTGTTDAFSTTTNGTFTVDAGQDRPDREREEGGQGDQGEQDQNQESAPEQQVQDAEPTPTSVIAIEGEPAAATAAPEPDAGASDPISVITIEGDPPPPTPDATPPPAAAGSDSGAEGTVAQSPSAQVFMTSALYAFPGETEADAWLAAQRERLVANGTSGSGTFSEISDAPALGDASVTFATQRQAGAGEEIANGFRFYSRSGAIVAVLEIGGTSDLPLNDAARIMELQVGCIQSNGCNGVASLSGRLVGAIEAPAPETDDQAETEEPRPDRAAEPRPERQPREGREQQPQAPVEAPPVEEPAPPPVEEPTPIPIEEPTEVPVEEPTQPPIEEGTPPPAEEGTPPAGEEPTPPAEEPTPPAEEPTPPAEEPTQVPSEEPTPPPAEEPTQVPSEEPMPPPVAEPTAIPTPGPIVEDDQPPDDGGGRDDRDRDDRDRDRDRGRDRE